MVQFCICLWALSGPELGYIQIDGRGGGLPPPRANPYTRKKSMGVNSDDFSIFLIVYSLG